MALPSVVGGLRIAEHDLEGARPELKKKKDRNSKQTRRFCEHSRGGDYEDMWH